MKKLFLIAVFCLLSLPVKAQTLIQQVEACTALPKPATCEIVIPPGIHVQNKAWNLRELHYLTIKGTGTVIWHFETDPAPAVCMDTSGTLNIVIDGPTFAIGSVSKWPQLGWLHSRPVSKVSQTRLAVTNVKWRGWYTKAAVAFIGVENGMFIGMDVSNGVPNTTSMFMSRGNELGLVSQFGSITMDPLTITATNNTFWNCAFEHAGHTKLTPPETNDMGFGLTLGSGVHDIIIVGGSTSGGTRGGVLRILGAGNRRISVNANWESKLAKAAIVIDGEVVGLQVLGGLLMAQGPAVRLNGAADGLNLKPLEMICDEGLIAFGPNGKLFGRGLSAVGVQGN